jgi:hypothetical protein
MSPKKTAPEKNATEIDETALDGVAAGGLTFTYYPGFTGGVRVASGDVTGDGTLDLIPAPSPGGGPR